VLVAFFIYRVYDVSIVSGKNKGNIPFFFLIFKKNFLEKNLIWRERPQSTRFPS